MAKRDAVLKKPKDTKGTLLRMLRYVGDFKWLLALVLVLCLTSNVLALLGPNLAGKAINAAAAGKGHLTAGTVPVSSYRSGRAEFVLLPGFARQGGG